MAENKKSDSGLSSTTTVTLVLAMIAALAMTGNLPYKDERPSNQPFKTHYDAAQDIDARLWQDPFAAIDGVDEDTEKKNWTVVMKQGAASLNLELEPDKNTSPHGLDQLTQGKEEEFKPGKIDKITVLAVTLPGGPFQEDAEMRMRHRYAVLSALANQRWTPDDERHIGYFKPESEADQTPEKNNRETQKGENIGKESKNPIAQPSELQKKVPFEWWTSDNQKKKFLLLWVDEESLSKRPNYKLNKLIGKVKTTLKDISNQAKVDQKVIGPNTSTLLLDMLNEANEQPCSNKEDITYYSAIATAPDDELLLKITDKKLNKINDYLKKCNITLYRTTATDDEMMKMVANELDLRRVKKTDHVVILSEWDTFYGRSMPKAFKKNWYEKDEKDGQLVYEYGYMRGLDGKLPDDGDKDAKKPEKKSDNSDKNANQPDTQIEATEGESQKDYLRRLAKHIVELDEQLQSEDFREGVAAIGVLGSDVHDKIEILEALRQYFPHKPIFTTDLDAAYSHPDNWQQAHNLLVVSAYGLHLQKDLQGSIPPFRDSHQTAFYMTMQATLKGDRILNGVKIPIVKIQKPFPPLMFEIGHTHPVLLTPPPDTESKPPLKSHPKMSQCNWDKFRLCQDSDKPEVNDFDVNVKYLPTITIPVIFFLAMIIALFNNFYFAIIYMYLMFIVMVHLVKIFIANTSESIKNLSVVLLLLYPAFLFLMYNIKNLVIEIILITLLLFFNKSFRKYSNDYIRNKLRNLLFHFLIIFLLSFFSLFIINNLNYEPLYWREGLSIWPSQLLRILAVIFSCLFIEYGQEIINKMLTDLQADRSNNNELPLALSAKADTNTKSNYIFIEDSEDWSEETKAEVSPDTLWKKYLGYIGNEDEPKWFNRVLAHVCVYLVGIGLIMHFSNTFPNVPARGNFAYYTNTFIILLAAFSTLFLITWVVDNAHLCHNLIKALSAKPSRWHRKAKDLASKEHQVPPECLNDWLDIKLVAKLTDTLQKLTWGPVVCIILLAVARNQVIDDWDMPWTLALLFIALLAYLISAEVMLQLAATKARKKAIDSLTKKISKERNKKAPNDNIIKRIEAEIERIEALREGAFRPWYEWPLLQAYGSLGSILLALEHFGEALVSR